MSDKKVAVVGGGFAGISLIAGIVRAAINNKQTNFSITLFEPDIIGPGLAYDLDAPDAFKLNHELDFMGSVNAQLAQTDAKDFYRWVQDNRTKLEQRYASYDLTNPKEYVPRNLFGKYLRARYQELKEYAASYRIAIHENRSKVNNIHKLERCFIIEAAGTRELFDVVALTTGNYFNQIDPILAQTGKYFRPYDYRSYVSEAITDGSIMLIAGSALSAYDAAMYALESGKYSKVIMASRRGMLRKVRGNTVPYVRQYITIDHLEMLAGGPGRPFRLEHLLKAIKAELKHAYGRTIRWKEGYSVQEIVGILKRDIAAVKEGRTLIWRSIHSSLTDDERHEIYNRLADEDKQEFVSKYGSLYQLFSAPMPITNATKLLQYIEEGKLEIVNGMQKITYDQAKGSFEVWYAHKPNGTPLPLGKTPKNTGAPCIAYPIKADICVDAMGLGRDIHHLPLYRNLMESGLAASNSVGGIQVDIDTRYVIDIAGDSVEGLYAIGHMTCGKTLLPHNSLHLSRVGIAIGAAIADYLTEITPAKSNRGYALLRY